MDDTNSQADPYALARFTQAQNPLYNDVVRELRAGRKQSHWMWFIFPQLTGLGSSMTSRYFAIRDLHEARAYLDHPLLGQRLRACTQMINAIEGRSVTEIFGQPDDAKFRSSMTLFECVSPDGPFTRALEKYFAGERDQRTLQLVDRGA